MKKTAIKTRAFFLVFPAIFTSVFLTNSVNASTTTAPGIEMAQQTIKSQHTWITTDHSKHDILKNTFSSGPEMTEACLSCHTEAALQFHKTIHWTWKDPSSPAENRLGKGGLSINNF